MTPEQRTAPYCGKCERILRNTGKQTDTITLRGTRWTHDHCGGQVAGSWRVIHDKE